MASNTPRIDVQSTESVTGVGLSDPDLNLQIRRKLDAMNRLHSTGVQIDIDLPQIAVIGNQSAGKSSLIEAISGITLPRNSGTCTRCPTECRLARTDGPWQCIVSLRLTTDKVGQPLGQARNVQFGGVILEKSKVEERIRRAQRAILNPSKSADIFLNEPEEDVSKDSELSFSKNCITLQISGPDVADLSFCDLPGLIASVSTGSGGDDNSISLVENLITSYIKKPSCIILLTVACETDFENQGAHRLAKIHDPDGKRTIGVLTKPDRIPYGEESTWLPFIRDERERLDNNWFCVKQPSSFELKQKMTWGMARKKEEEFFASKAPWSELDSTYKKYLGTSNLVKRLSNVLSDLIATRVPQIQDELERAILEAREALSRLPLPPASDPRGEILTLLHTFTQDLAQQIQGVPDGIESAAEVGLIQAIRPEQEKFKRAIRTTAPQFWPFERFSDGQLEPAWFLYAEEDENAADGSWPATGVSEKIFIDEVLRRAQSARTRELPGHYPFVVQKSFIDHIIKKWGTPSDTLCNAIHAIVSRQVKQFVHKHFAHFGQGKLEQQIRSILQQHINECRDRAEERIKWLQRTEAAPFTLNTHYLADYKDKFLAHYKGAREKYMQQALAKEREAESPLQQPTGSPQMVFDWKAPGSLNTAILNTATRTNGVPGFPSPSFSSNLPFSFAGVGGSTNSGLGTSNAGLHSASRAAPELRFPPSNAPVFPPTKASGFTPSNAGSPTSSTGTETPNPSSLKKILSGLAEIGITGVTEADLPKLLPPDRMEPALVIMADVRAYFQVAYKRFVDMVPQAIDVELVRGLENDLHKVLISHLGISSSRGEDIFKELAAENRRVADRRVDLKKKLERLEAGHLELFTAFV